MDLLAGRLPVVPSDARSACAISGDDAPHQRPRAGIALTASVLTTALGAHSAAPPSQEQAPVFRAGADVVSVEASVRRDRRAVIGLKSADFELLDNGVAQEITEVSYEKLPIDVTVLLDTSASVTGAALDQLRDALRQLRTRPRCQRSPAADDLQHEGAAPDRFR